VDANDEFRISGPCRWNPPPDRTSLLIRPCRYIYLSTPPLLFFWISFVGILPSVFFSFSSSPPVAGNLTHRRRKDTRQYLPPHDVRRMTSSSLIPSRRGLFTQFPPSQNSRKDDYALDYVNARYSETVLPGDSNRL